MKRLLLLLILVSASTHAEHHRDHVIERIDRMTDSLTVLEDYLDVYVSEEVLTAEAADRVAMIVAVSDLIQAHAAQGRYLLGFSFVPVDFVRPIFSQKEFTFTQPDSISYWMGVLLFYLSLQNEATPNTNLTSALHQVMFAWWDLGEINWHIQDAIREEVYLDSDFIL